MAIRIDPKHRRKTRKIFYGPPGNEELYWTVKIKLATKPVRIEGTLEDAIAGFMGSTIGCHLSNCATAKANARAFDHPVLMAVFTRKTCIIITKVKNGVPSEGVEYYHDHSNVVMLNDRDEFKTYIKAHPELANRTLSLRPPEKAKAQAIGRPSGPSKPTGEKRAFAPRGAMLRARDAGFLSEAV